MRTVAFVARYGDVAVRFGLVLSLMSWLLVVAGAIVLGAGIGRVLGADPAEPVQQAVSTARD